MKSIREKFSKLNIKHILIFLLIISFFGMCIYNFLKSDKDFSENENRTLSQMPEFSLSALISGKYTEDFDSYLSDQFAARDFFVSLRTYMEKLFLKHENNGVLFGKDDYFIEVPDNSKKEIARDNISALSDMDKLDNFSITACIVPTAFEILRDKLPYFSYNDSVVKLQKEIDTVLENTNVKVADVTDILRERKDDYIFYRTDHHQTALGSYLVYKGLGESLGYEPYSEESFEIKVLSDDFYGTTWSKTMLSCIEPDKIYSYKLLNSDTSCVIHYPHGKKDSLDSFYDTEKLKSKDKYAVYLGGVHPLQVVHSKAKNDRKLAIIKDSYAHSLVPFLANHFNEIHLIDMRYYSGDVVEYLNTENISDVLVLYNSATFMTDPSVSKLSSYSSKLLEKYKLFGPVKEGERVGDSYFDDAVFLGDSLTDGLRLYSSLSTPKFVAGTGLTINGVFNTSINGGATAFERLKDMSFKKIYIMLGINERLSENNVESFKNEYKELILRIRQSHPDAYIYLQSLFPVTEKRSASDKSVNNHNINLYNKAIKDISIKNQCYYLAVNEVMMNKKGALPVEATFDGVHPTKDYYEKWVEYLKTHAVSDGKATFDRKKATLSQEGQKLLEIAGKLEGDINFDEDLSMIDLDAAKAIYPLEDKGIKDMVILSGSGATADEIAIFKITSKNRKEAVKVVKSRIEARKNDFRTYIPKEVPKLNKPIIKWNDEMLIVVVTNDNKNAEKIVEKIIG